MSVGSMIRGKIKGQIEGYKDSRAREALKKKADDAALKAEMSQAEGKARKKWAKREAQKTADARYASNVGVGSRSKVSRISDNLMDLGGSGGMDYGLGGGGNSSYSSRVNDALGGGFDPPAKTRNVRKKARKGARKTKAKTQSYGDRIDDILGGF